MTKDSSLAGKVNGRSWNKVERFVLFGNPEGDAIEKNLNCFSSNGAQLGDAESQGRVGQAYESGAGVTKDLNYELAAKQGAQLGGCYFSGKGVEKDEKNS